MPILAVHSFTTWSMVTCMGRSEGLFEPYFFGINYSFVRVPCVSSTLDNKGLLYLSRTELEIYFNTQSCFFGLNLYICVHVAEKSQCGFVNIVPVTSSTILGGWSCVDHLDAFILIEVVVICSLLFQFLMEKNVILKMYMCT